MTLTVNGEVVELIGGNQVLGRGTTNSGQNPTRDPMEEDGDTPTGVATVTTVLDRNEDGYFVNDDGTLIENEQGEPSSQLTVVTGI